MQQPTKTAPPSPASLAAAARFPYAAQRPRVLVVDSTPAFRAAVASELENRGYDVVVADGERDALALLPGAGAVVFDLELPGIDGTRLLAALTREQQRRHRPLVALAGSRSPNVITRLREMGVQQVLVKPFIGPAEVVQAIACALPIVPVTPRPVAA
jgi:CheY-like chemotaxis protein